MIKVEKATEKDLPTIRQLADRTWWPTYGPILQREQIEYMLTHLYSEETLTNSMRNGETFLLLSDHESPAGFASFAVWKGDPSIWKINKLYVLPENHGKGYGRKLIDEVSGRARKAGIDTLILNVNRHNPALGFYQKLGFQKLHEEDIPVGPYWMNDFVMKLKL